MKTKDIFYLKIFLLLQSCFLFSHENSCDTSSSKNNTPQAEIHLNGQCDTSPKNSWHFSTQIRSVPNYSNMQRANCTIVIYGSPELQHYFHNTITPHMYDATIKNQCCILPGYQLPHGLRSHMDQISQFSGIDAALTSNLNMRLETYCNRIEALVFSGKEFAFCDDLSFMTRVELVKIYADFLKEFYAEVAPYIFYEQSQQHPLMKQVMPTINWSYYDGDTVTPRSKTLEQRKVALVSGNLGVVYKAFHEGDFEKANTVGNEIVTVGAGKKAQSTSVFKTYPALQQKVEQAYDDHKSNMEQKRLAQEKEAQQKAAIVQAECTSHVLQKSHFDILQQRYDAATRTILNSQSVKTIHKVNALQANYLDADHLTSDRKGILLNGNHLQHHLVDEVITVVDAVISNDLTESMHDAVVDLTNASLSLNKNGDVVMASRTLDACWALIDFAKDAANYTYSALSTHVPLIAKGACDGVCESLHGAVHMVCHPVEAVQDVVNSFVVAGYYLGKLAYADCVLEAAIDLLETDPKYCEQMIGLYATDPQTLVAIYEYAQKNNVTEDVARVGTKAAIDMMLLHGVTKAVSAIATESLPTFLSCMRKGGESADVAMTTEGVPLRCAEEVACLMEQMENANAKVSAGAVVSSRNLVDGIVSKLMSDMKAEIETLKKLFDCKKNCVPDCLKRGFAEFKNHHIKIPYEHILGIELKWDRIKGTLSRISGFHHDFMGVIEKSEALKFVRKGVEQNGCYLADIIVDGLTIRNKTFFPQHWSREKVISKIHEAYENFLKSGSIAQVAENGKYRINAFTNEGIEIEMYFAKNGQMATAYPIVKIGI